MVAKMKALKNKPSHGKISHVNVLGVDYRVHKGTLEDYPILSETLSDGLCDYSIKSIFVRDTQLDMPETGDMENQKYLTNISLRHELVHAYLHEAGQEGWCLNEHLVNFLAMSLPKLYRLCEEAGAIDTAVKEQRKAA